MSNFSNTPAAEPIEADLFGKLVLNRTDDASYWALAKLFNEELRRAVDHGRICTPERMAILYPILRDINIEQEEIQRIWDEDIRRDEERRARAEARLAAWKCRKAQEVEA